MGPGTLPSKRSSTSYSGTAPMARLCAGLVAAFSAFSPKTLKLLNTAGYLNTRSGQQSATEAKPTAAGLNRLLPVPPNGNFTTRIATAQAASTT